ncbi:hypothetical protein CBL_08642 [Carabus blaptoides fortunei]
MIAFDTILDAGQIKDLFSFARFLHHHIEFNRHGCSSPVNQHSPSGIQHHEQREHCSSPVCDTVVLRRMMLYGAADATAVALTPPTTRASSPPLISTSISNDDAERYVRAAPCGGLHASSRPRSRHQIRGGLPPQPKGLRRMLLQIFEPQPYSVRRTILTLAKALFGVSYRLKPGSCCRSPGFALCFARGHLQLVLLVT